MKIKLDFVTNSSSCSFIIGVPKGTVSDILECMASRYDPNRYEDWDNAPIEINLDLDYYELEIDYGSANDLLESVPSFLEKKYGAVVKSLD